MMWEIVLLFVLLLAIPFVGYFTIKFGTFAFYRGRQLFNQFEEKESGDGEKQKA